MAVANPFNAQLQQFNANIGGARQGLIDIYKQRRRGREQTYNDLNSLYGGQYNKLQALIGSNASAFGAATRGGQQLYQANGYDVGGDVAQQQQLSRIVAKGAAPFQQESLSNLRAAVTLSQGQRKGALQEQQQLKASLPRERSAALSELESGIVDTQTNLFLDKQSFDQQQAYNQSLQRFYDASTANFAIGSAGGGEGGMATGARRYLGIPYKWGGEGPNGFDCSGLVQQVARDNGINLPRTASQQQSATPLVGGGLRNAQPGDLLFWGSPAHHVAIYVGSGMMIAAPHSGANVRVQAVYGTPEVHRAAAGASVQRNFASSRY